MQLVLLHNAAFRHQLRALSPLPSCSCRSPRRRSLRLLLRSTRPRRTCWPSWKGDTTHTSAGGWLTGRGLIPGFAVCFAVFPFINLLCYNACLGPWRTLWLVIGWTCSPLPAGCWTRVWGCWVHGHGSWLAPPTDPQPCALVSADQVRLKALSCSSPTALPALVGLCVLLVALLPYGGLQL